MMEIINQKPHFVECSKCKTTYCFASNDIKERIEERFTGYYRVIYVECPICREPLIINKIRISRDEHIALTAGKN